MRTVELSALLNDTTHGITAPWFRQHLRHGNSLIGARRTAYTPQQVESKSWLVTEASKVHGQLNGRIFHFLLPAKGWGAGTSGLPKHVAGLALDHVQAVKKWQKSITQPPPPLHLEKLQGLSEYAARLWDLSVVHLSVVDREGRPHFSGPGHDATGFTRVPHHELEASMRDMSSPYRRLRAVMDAWCALWFWPPTTHVAPPSLEQWIDYCEATLRGNSVDASWAAVVREVASKQAFFHWELDFAPVFAGRGAVDHASLGRPSAAASAAAEVD